MRTLTLPPPLPIPPLPHSGHTEKAASLQRSLLHQQQQLQQNHLAQQLMALGNTQQLLDSIATANNNGVIGGGIGGGIGVGGIGGSGMQQQHHDVHALRAQHAGLQPKPQDLERRERILFALRNYFATLQRPQQMVAGPLLAQLMNNQISAEEFVNSVRSQLGDAPALRVRAIYNEIVNMRASNVTVQVAQHQQSSSASSSIGNNHHHNQQQTSSKGFVVPSTPASQSAATSASTTAGKAKRRTAASSDGSATNTHSAATTSKKAKGGKGMSVFVILLDCVGGGRRGEERG